MTAKRFADTNILLYAISTLAADSAKTAIAQDLLMSDDLALSAQILQEFYWQATHPARKHKVPHQEAVAFARTVCAFPVQEMTVELFEAATSTKHRFGISYWDAAVIEAARTLGCETVLSEDLNDRQDYGGVRVVNPFR